MMGNIRLNFINRGVLATIVVMTALVTPMTGAASTGSTRFTNFQVADTISSPVGTVCHSTQTPSPCSKLASEPAIRADLSGNFYGSSEHGLGAGTEAWKSTDGGLHYALLSQPNGVSSANDTPFAPGGGDTDLATATAKNASGLY